MAVIERGGAAARAAWNLIDPNAVERTPISLLPDEVGNEAVRTLMLIARCVISAVAACTYTSPTDLRADVWRQLAILPEDNPASESVRILLTAWDDPDLAELVTADMFSDANPADIAFEFGVLLASTFTTTVGAAQQYYDTIRAWLGA